MLALSLCRHESIKYTTRQLLSQLSRHMGRSNSYHSCTITPTIWKCIISTHIVLAQLHSEECRDFNQRHPSLPSIFSRIAKIISIICHVILANHAGCPVTVYNHIVLVQSEIERLNKTSLVRILLMTCSSNPSSFPCFQRSSNKYGNPTGSF